jgi:hypothetical protein
MTKSAEDVPQGQGIIHQKGSVLTIIKLPTGKSLQEELHTFPLTGVSLQGESQVYCALDLADEYFDGSNPGALHRFVTATQPFQNSQAGRQESFMLQKLQRDFVYTAAKDQPKCGFPSVVIRF